MDAAVDAPVDGAEDDSVNCTVDDPEADITDVPRDPEPPLFPDSPAELVVVAAVDVDVVAAVVATTGGKVSDNEGVKVPDVDEDELSVELLMLMSLEFFFVPTTPPTAPPMTAPRTITMITKMVILPLRVRQKDWVGF